MADPCGGPVDPNPQYPSYPPYGYSPVGYPPPPPPPSMARPGAVLTAAILGYILAGLLFAAAILLFVGASVISTLGAGIQGDVGSTVAEALVDGAANLLSGGLLLGGALVMLTRQLSGRTIFTAGAGLCLVAGVYWSVRAGSVDVAPLVLLFVALTVAALVLAWLPAVGRWLRS